MEKQSTHRIIINGKTVNSVSQADARANLGRIFKLGDEQLDKIFQGKPLVFKKGLTGQQVEKFTTALKKCGVRHKVDPPLPKVEDEVDDDIPQPDHDFINAAVEAARREAEAEKAAEQGLRMPQQSAFDAAGSVGAAGNENDFEATVIMDNAPGHQIHLHVQGLLCGDSVTTGC